MQQLIKRKKIKPKFKRLTISPKANRNGLDGLDGINGFDGQDGDDGQAGINGISVIDAIQLDEKSFKLKFSNGGFSQKLQIPEAKPAPGADGEKGDAGDDGKVGESAPKIVDIQAFSRRVIFKFSDGSEISVPLSFPSGDPNNPAIGFGGTEPSVKDIIAGQNIFITDSNGIFTINATGGDTGGLPFYFIPFPLRFTVPVNRQHLTLGEFTVAGEMNVDGEQVIL